MGRRTQLFVVLYLAVAVVLAAHCRRFWPFFSDDALISLRYSMRLAEGHGLSWSGTDRVEGYSDLLWVLLTAPAHVVGLDLMWTARVLDFLGALAAIGAVSLSVDTLRPRPVRLVTGGLALATSAPVAVWAIGGLEHGLMLGVLGAALLLVLRELGADRSGPRAQWIAGTLLGLLCLLRLDGAVLCLGMGLGVMIAMGLRKRMLVTVGRLAALPVGLVALQTVFRRIYHGEWIPHTAGIKVTFSAHRLKEGLEYVRDGSATLALPLLAATAAVVLLVRRGTWRTRVILPTTLTLVWAAYVAIVGGDIFPGWRQLLFVLIPLASLIADGAEQLEQERSGSTRWVWLVALPAAALNVYVQAQNKHNIRASKELWEWDGEAVGDLLRRAFGQHRPLLAVSAAGALPYWYRLDCIDMLGLNDRHIAKTRPPGFGTGEIGHEVGDGEYVLEHNPDLVVFCNSSGRLHPCFYGERELTRIRGFVQRYQFVKARGQIGNRALAQMFVRREDGPLGVQRSADRIVIPGYFFASRHSELEAELGAGDRLVVPVVRERPGEIDPLMVPQGTWRVMIDGRDDAPLDVGFRCPRVSAARQRSGSNWSVRLDHNGPLRITVAPTETSSYELREVALVRDESLAPTHVCQRGGALRVQLLALSAQKRENTFWAYPTNLVLSGAGARVDLGRTRGVAAIEISTDNDDQYELVLNLRGEPVHRFMLEPKPNGGGLTVRRIELPRNVVVGGVDQIEIRPHGGDRSYAVGHLLLDERLASFSPEPQKGSATPNVADRAGP